MSDENQPSGAPSGADKSAPTKRRRRRRRKPEGGSGTTSDAPSTPVKAKAETKLDSGGPSRQRNRKRRSRKRGGGQESAQGPAQESSKESAVDSKPEKSGQSGRKRRSDQSNRGQRSGRSKGNDREEKRARPPREAKPSAPIQSGPARQRRKPIVDTPSASPTRASTPSWGNDSDAPTPDIKLKADLPEDIGRPDIDPTSAYLLEQEEGQGFEGALSARISNIISVRFAVAGRTYLYDAGEGNYERGDLVRVESDRGERIARVATSSQRRPPPRSLKKILGRAPSPSASDKENTEAKEREFLSIAIAEAKKQKLKIKVFAARLEDGGRKLAISYSCEAKTDVRRLTRALSSQYSYPVDLRHFGARDEAKLVGGIGSCGQELCCTTWLPSFVPVSIKNAKDQGLVLNPSKVSGQCGRLKCCLVYEQDHYAELRKGLPKLGKRVVTNDGFEGRVVEVDVLHQRIRVGIGRGESKVYGKGEVKPMFASQAPGPKKGEKKKRSDNAEPSRSDSDKASSSDNTAAKAQPSTNDSSPDKNESP